MAYEKQTWVDGEIVSSEKLNHIERGLDDHSSSILMEGIEYKNNNIKQLSRTWNAIHEAFETERIIVCRVRGLASSYNTFSYITAVYFNQENNIYVVECSDGERFQCSNADEYPQTMQK